MSFIVSFDYIPRNSYYGFIVRFDHHDDDAPSWHTVHGLQDASDDDRRYSPKRRREHSDDDRGNSDDGGREERDYDRGENEERYEDD